MKNPFDAGNIKDSIAIHRLTFADPIKPKNATGRFNCLILAIYVKSLTYSNLHIHIFYFNLPYFIRTFNSFEIFPILKDPLIIL